MTKLALALTLLCAASLGGCDAGIAGSSESSGSSPSGGASLSVGCPSGRCADDYQCPDPSECAPEVERKCGTQKHCDESGAAKQCEEAQPVDAKDTGKVGN